MKNTRYTLFVCLLQNFAEVGTGPKLRLHTSKRPLVMIHLPRPLMTMMMTTMMLARMT